MKEKQSSLARKDPAKRILAGIVLFTVIPAMLCTGVWSCARSIQKYAESFYAETRFRDAEIISTLGLTEEDLQALSGMEEISDAEGVYETCGRIRSAEGEVSVNVASLAERVNVPLIAEGRLPGNARECAVEEPVLTALGLSLGDTVSVEKEGMVSPEYLNNHEFLITGVIKHPDHAILPETASGSYQVIVSAEAFEKEAMGNAFSKAELLFADAEKADRFSGRYEAAAEEAAAALKEIRAERTQIRYAEVKAIYEAEALEAAAASEKSAEEAYSAFSVLKECASQYGEEAAALKAAEEKLSEDAQALEEKSARMAEQKTVLTAARIRRELSQKEWEEMLEIAPNGNAQNTDAIRGGTAEALKNTRQNLIRSFEEIEDTKAALRKEIRETLEEGIGAANAGLLTWTETRDTADPDREDASAATFTLSEEMVFDLHLTMGENIYRSFARMGMSESELKLMFLLMTGESLKVPAGSDALTEVSAYIEEQFRPKEEAYEALASDALTWEEEHAAYLSDKAEYEAALAEAEAGEENENEEDTEAGNTEEAAGVPVEKPGDAAGNTDPMSALRKEAAEYRTDLARYTQDAGEYRRGLSKYAEDLSANAQTAAEGRRSGSAYRESYLRYLASADARKAAEEKAASLTECRWKLLLAEDNEGYEALRDSIRRVMMPWMPLSALFALAGFIAVFFMTRRWVRENERSVPQERSGGPSGKYRPLYTSFAGVIIGILSGDFLLARGLLASCSERYMFAVLPPVILPGLAAVLFLAGILAPLAAIRSKREIRKR